MKDRTEESLDTAAGQPEQQLQRQRELDTRVGVLELSTSETGWQRRPTRLAEGVNQRVRSPLRTSARSYSAQLVIRYLVLWVG
jgi:hypothetical protein